MSEQHCLQLLLLCLLSAAVPCAGYGTGPPAFTCLNGQPMHFDASGSMYPPYVGSLQLYTLKVNATQYAPNDVVQVELLPGKETKFEGFLIRAMRTGTRPVASAEGPLIGSLQCSNSAGAAMKQFTLYSPANTTNCIAHASEKDYTFLRCLWTAPATNEGPVMFLVTAVEDEDKYEMLTSAALSSTLGTPTLTAGVTQMSQMPSTDGCGSTKTCALFPPGCDTRGSCTHAVMMTERSDGKLLFEAFGATDQWVGVGIADTTEMEDMELYWCSYSSRLAKVTVETAYSPKETTVPVYRPLVTELSAMIQYNQGSASLPSQPTRIGCSFVRQKSETFTIYRYDASTRANAVGSVTSDMQLGKFVALAQGSMVSASSRQMAQHQFKPLQSPQKFITGSVQKMYFIGMSKTVQTHGTLMTIGWMFLAGFAIVIARHSRPVFNQKLVAKKDFWFLLHVVFMVLCFIMAVSGVIYMLVRHQGWESDSAEQTHGIIGVFGLCLALVNIVMGIFRCEPDAKYRWVFNRLHRYNGLLAVLFSGIAMWLGALMPENRPEFRLLAAIVLSLWTAVMVLGMLIFEVMRQVTAKRETTKRVMDNNYSMQNAQKDAGSQDEQQQQQQQQQEEQPVKGKRLRHVPPAAIIAFGAVLLLLSIVFWIGLWVF